MFFGRYDCVLDAKGRLNFPARFREEMGESFVVMEWIGRCLFALPMAEVERLSEKLGADELMDSWEITGDLLQHRLRGRAGQAGAHPAACRTAGACGAGKRGHCDRQPPPCRRSGLPRCGRPAVLL